MTETKKTFRKERFLVLVLLLIGAGLRLWETGRVPPGLYHDEAQHGLDALYVLETGEMSFYFPANNGREPVFIYLVTVSVALFGRSPLAVRLPSFFVGFLTLAATYDLGRVLWNRRTGRFALAVLSVTLWHVHLSRTGFRAVLLPLCTALILAQAARGLRSGRKRHWLAAGALYGLSWYTYMAARFTPAALFAMLLYGLLFHREATFKAWRGALFFCAAALVILLPLGIYTIIHPDIVLVRTGQVTITHPEINGGDFWGTLLKHTLRTAGMFFVRGDRIWRHNLAWRPVWDPALGLAFIIGTGLALIRFRRQPGAALALLWTAIMAVPTLLAEDAPHFLRGVGVLPTAALLPALGLAWLADAVFRLSPSRLTCVVHVPRSHVSRSHVPRLIPALLLLIGGTSTTYDYFIRFANAPLAYHWFESGPVMLAGQINTQLNDGWDGKTMLHGPETPRTVYIERQLWDSWSALPFLVPSEKVRRLSEATGGTLPLTFVVWPYREWETDVFALTPRPAYLRVEEGPQAQGDKDEQPFTVAMLIHADPRPDVPEPLARFEQGVILRAALVSTQASEATVRLWWESDGALPADYTVFVHYLRDGNVIAQHDAQPGYGHLRTSTWLAGDLILDEHTLPGIAPDPARDTVRIGLYRAGTLEGLLRLGDGGTPAGDWVETGVILSP